MGTHHLMKLKIRKAVPEDLNRLVEIVRSLPEYFLPEHLDDIEADIRRDENLVAEIDNKMMGFINYRVASPGLVEIQWMAISPEAQSKGIGSSLMTEFIAQIQNQGIKVIELSTIASSDNFEPYKRTRKFYEKFGFKEIRIDKDYYGPGDDRGIMRKEL